MTYNAIPTLAGQAALAAAIDIESPTPIVIAEMVIGDGNGNLVTPLETMTGLVNLRATLPIATQTRDGTKVTFDAILDEDEGGYTIREAGLIDEHGVLLFVASVPATLKQTQIENVYDILTLGMTVVISDTAQIVLQPPAESLVSIADMIRPPFISVDSVVNAVPSEPANDNCYLIGSTPTGVFAGQAHNLAQWNGNAWVFRNVAPTHVIGVAANGHHLERTDEGWRRIYMPTRPLPKRAELLFYGTM